MRIGVPTEIKNHEYRVGMTPESADEAIRHGHEVLVQAGAGMGIGADDAQYQAVGAKIIPTAEEVFAQAEMIVKVKEPQAVERKMLREGQLLFTYLHLAPDPEQTKDLVESGATCIAYETVTDRHGGLPLLKPMSQVAGRMSIQAGAHCLEKAQKGRGVLLGGVPGVAPAKVAIIGGGVVGSQAALMAAGLGAEVTVFDRDANTLERLDFQFNSQVKTRFSNAANLSEAAAESDLIVGAVLIPGASAPKLISRDMLSTMKPGAVLVDVAIDQGGCFETSRATTHADPTYIIDDVVHYCVANMPGAVARTSTYALNNVTLPFTLALANKGWRQALTDDAHLREGLNVSAGHVNYEAVAKDLGYAYQSAMDAIGHSA